MASKQKKHQDRSRAGAWIVSPRWDTAFVVGTPLLCLLFVLVGHTQLSSLELWIGVMAFGAMGHHFPGFLRAYTDPELFARFRWRFLLAPPLIFGTFLYFGDRQLYGLVLVVALWGLWHGMMQHYGFMRIYDAKAGVRSRGVARWDWWLCVAWFSGFVVWNPGRFHNVLEGLYRSGFPLIPAGVARAAPAALGLVVGAVTLAYLLRLRGAAARGEAPNPNKLRLLVGTLAFLGVAFLAFDDLLLGLVAWELYHDIQYLAVVWIFNKRRSAQGAAGWAMRRLFRPGLAFAGLYVLLCLGWGGLGFIGSTATGSGQTVLVALLGTSALLHFYYDGFIWKVRESGTSSALGISGATKAEPAARAGWAVPIRQPLSFVLVLLVLLLLGGAEKDRDRGILESLSLSVPDAVGAQLDWATALRQDGRLEESSRLLQRSLAIDPGCLRAHNELGVLLNNEAQVERALAHFEEARKANPRYAPGWSNLAMARLRLGVPAEAAVAAREAIRLDPSLAPAHNNLAAALAATDRLAEAGRALEEALRLQPDLRPAQANRRLLDEAVAEPNSPAPGLYVTPSLDLRPDTISSGRRCGNAIRAASSPAPRGSSPAASP